MENIICRHVILLFVFTAATPSQSSSIKTDAAALLSFKKNIQADTKGVLSDWKLDDDKDPCTWNGVTCSLRRITEIDLSGASLDGGPTFSLYPLSVLDMLSVLKLSSNSLFLNSTSSLLHLPYGLRLLDLSLTRMSGPVPQDLFTKCPNLKEVNLALNNLTGPLPENFFSNADNLQLLDMSYNNLSGSISGLKIVERSCSSLLQLDLSTNHLSDSIPVSFSNCTNLQSLTLTSNLFSGPIPQALGRLRSLQRIDLSHNNISG